MTRAGRPGNEHLRVAATIQLALGGLFALVALVLRGPIQDGLFEGSATLYWILIVAVLAYAVSYFARGFLAGHRRFGLYGGLVLMESCTRALFALAVAVGIASGQSIVALGIAAAPIVSLAVVPFALARTSAGATPPSRRSRPRTRPSSPFPTAPGSPWRCSRSCSPSRRSSTPGRCW